MTTTCDSTIRPWADLPPELFHSIVDDLGLLDLLSFRGVCKSWRAAAIASQATARAESLPGREPWLLIHRDNNNNSQCLLVNADQEKYYLTIPELEGATCIASANGWLLLANEDSIFFFCPFSRSRIDLPPLPLKLSQLSDQVAAFSSPPTSDDCIVCVPNRNKASGLELFTLSRGGDEVWNRHAVGFNNEQLGGLACATFCNARFCFRDRGNGYMTFSLPDKEGILYRVYSAHEAVPPDTVTLPFNYLKRRAERSKKHIVDWSGGGSEEDGVSLSTCGTMVQRTGALAEYVQNETADPESPDTSARLRGIWLHPRFFQLPRDQRWKLQS